MNQPYPVRWLSSFRPKRHSCFARLAVLLSIMKADDLAARDLAALANLVAPAYTAMQFAGICGQDISWFVSQPRGMRGSAIHYAEHVKEEVIASLTYDDAVIVLTAAADAARTIARQELRKLRSTGPQQRRRTSACGAEPMPMTLFWRSSTSTTELTRRSCWRSSARNVGRVPRRKKS
jgi:hypothetical protein